MADHIMKIADIEKEHVESINGCQSSIKTTAGKDVILIAYEK